MWIDQSSTTFNVKILPVNTDARYRLGSICVRSISPGEATIKNFFIRKSVKHRHSHDSFLFTMKDHEPHALPQLLS